MDTSTEACSVALCVGEREFFRYELAPRLHTALVLPMVTAVCEEAGIALSAIEAIAFARGPGAFTGLRIAAGVVQGLAYGLQVPVISVSTLAVMAHRAWRERGWNAVHTAIDARMGEVYFGSYRVEGAGRVALVGREVVAPLAELLACAQLVDSEEAALVGEGPASKTISVDSLRAGGWTGYGSGWVYREALQQQLPDVVDLQVEGYPHALDLLALGRVMFAAGEYVNAENALPVYLRDSVVQVKEQVKSH
ncbi:Hypothetical protein HDN1F_28490 [gamma proteobacterium HdN1]|nr:Hypothetical protein HDN1F_28490 [gamma proteobacterium HdN1]